MIVRKVNNNTFDVFMAPEFWGDWTRVRFGSNGIYTVAGRRLSNKALRDVAQAINGS